jgi:hypothetical protein
VSQSQRGISDWKSHETHRVTSTSAFTVTRAGEEPLPALKGPTIYLIIILAEGRVVLSGEWSESTCEAFDQFVLLPCANDHPIALIAILTLYITIEQRLASVSRAHNNHRVPFSHDRAPPFSLILFPSFKWDLAPVKQSTVFMSIIVARHLPGLSP